MNIIKYPDPRLTTLSEEVKDFGADLQFLVTDMLHTLVNSQGVGLAAIQVGVPLRVMVFRNDAGRYATLVNPEIIETKGIKFMGHEGCLSIPGKVFYVPRYDRVQVRFLDITGSREETRWFIGSVARIVQHEIDHMDGNLIGKPRSIPEM